MKFAHFKSKDRWIKTKVIAARRRLKAHINPTYKTKPLRKRRSKPQVSEVFNSVSIDLWTCCIKPKYHVFVFESKVQQGLLQVRSDFPRRTIESDRSPFPERSPSVRKCVICWSLAETASCEIPYKWLMKGCWVHTRSLISRFLRGL